MTTYEPTPTKRIKQNLPEKLLKFIARITSPKRDTEKINDIAEVPDNTMYTRLKSLFQKLYTVTYKKINTSDSAWVISTVFTKLGERVVFMQLDCNYEQVTFRYFDSKDAESFSNDTPIFSLKVTPKRLILNPFNTPLSSHDIDMAIYEIEQIVEKEFGVIVDESNKHYFNEHDLNEHHKKEKQFIEQSRKLKAKEQECKRLKWYMQEIRMQELSHLDIEWDEYETHCTNTEYSNIINLVEEALEERSPEDCRMTDKQIVIDYKTICENYSKEIGCCNTFDGSCSKEECFTYRLLQLLQAKEKECEDGKNG